jgi:hypothetical protein
LHTALFHQCMSPLRICWAQTTLCLHLSSLWCGLSHLLPTSTLAPSS